MQDWIYYIHKKTGRRYRVWSYPVWNENTQEEMVLYHDNRGKHWVRPQEQFNDGRFVIDKDQTPWDADKIPYAVMGEL